MTSTSPHPSRGVLLALLVVVGVACGRITQPAASEPTSEPPAAESSSAEVDYWRTVLEGTFHLWNSEMQAAPTFQPWSGGDPTWPLSVADSDRLIFAYTEGFTAKDDPAKDGFPRMPEECYAIQLGEGSPYPKDRCLYPVLRELGVSEDAIRYYDETNGTMVLGLVGDGPVKVAHMWWGPFGSNDYPEAQILTPLGFMMATPVEWAPYAAAQEEATRSDVLPRIIAATGEGTPYSFVPVYPWQIHEPVGSATGWSVATTSRISGSCHACGVEFAGRFVLEFALDGTPTGARFDGFCAFASEALDGNGQRVEGADADAIAALKAELPVCEPAHWGESVIDWPALKAAQG